MGSIHRSGGSPRRGGCWRPPSRPSGEEAAGCWGAFTAAASPRGGSWRPLPSTCSESTADRPGAGGHRGVIAVAFKRKHALWRPQQGTCFLPRDGRCELRNLGNRAYARRWVGSNYGVVANSGEAARHGGRHRQGWVGQEHRGAQGQAPHDQDSIGNVAISYSNPKHVRTNTRNLKATRRNSEGVVEHVAHESKIEV